jgi:hypothetical protein
MKFTFEANELIWLDSAINQILIAAARKNNVTVQKTFSKLRYKFTPNVRYVNLNQKERNELLDVVVYRAKAIPGGMDFSPEITVLKGLLNKLGGVE